MSSDTRVSRVVFASRHSLRVFKAGEVIRGYFDGSPLISIFDPSSESGGLTKLGPEDLESGIKAYAASLSSSFKKLQDVQLKVIATQADESRVQALIKQYVKDAFKIANCKIASFPAGEKLECYFYSSTGRLRVAPLSASPALPDAAPVTPLKPQASVRVSPSNRKSRVLIVDDSKTIRQILRKIIESSPQLEVVGEIENPTRVEKAIAELKPDVMTLDIQMPEMTGVELLRKLLPKTFIPTVMISSLSINEGDEVLNALELGAIDYIQKPSSHEIAALTPIIHEKLISAASVRKARVSSAAKASVDSRIIRPSGRSNGVSLIAVGASTGGTEAIKSIFTCFPGDMPPIAVVQHIPPHFSLAFARRLNDLCRFEVREAKDGDEFVPGLALVAPGGLHMEVRREGERSFARVFDGPTVNRFKPSVDVLFNSVAKQFGSKATGVLLTGMGSDGAKGLLAMKQAGAYTIAQDEESSVVFGMPRVAIELGAAQLIRPLGEIANSVLVRPAA